MHIACNSVFAADTIVKTICISTTYMQNFILFENNYHFKGIGIHLWKTVYINTSYMLNCILCEKNHHFKSIDIHYTSSPLFTTCILFVTVSLLQTQL
nr:unnamed protein product [Callosobruchus analis]